MSTFIVPHQTAVSGVFDDFLGEIPATKQNGVSTGFYIAPEVLEVVERKAKERKVSKSKIVEKALRQVLAIK